MLPFYRGKNVEVLLRKGSVLVCAVFKFEIVLMEEKWWWKLFHLCFIGNLEVDKGREAEKKEEYEQKQKQGQKWLHEANKG